MYGFAGFFTYFSTVSDPGVERTTKHYLADVLIIAVCTMICGGKGFADIEDSIEEKEEWMR